MCAAVVLLCVASAAAAQRVTDELWPELDLYWRPAEHQRTFLQLSSSTDQEGTKHEGTVGLYQDYLFLPGGYLRGGYQFTFSVRDASYRESRIVGEATLGRDLGPRLRLINRTRVEPRWINGEYSYRVRDRVQLQRDAANVQRSLFIPYGTFEVYYDSRFEKISRLAGRVGNLFRFSERTSLDVYLARQDNSRSSLKSINALGTTFAVTF